jgi:hypothetical protein
VEQALSAMNQIFKSPSTLDPTLSLIGIQVKKKTRTFHVCSAMFDSEGKSDYEFETKKKKSG